MLDKATERILRRMDRMGFAGAGEALREIESQQAEIERLRYDLGLERHSNERLRGLLREAIQDPEIYGDEPASYAWLKRAREALGE